MAGLAKFSGAALAVALLLPFPAHAQEWARKMFDATEHDFGYVARGATVEHRFTITNLYKEDIHIAGVRSSCGCTTVSLTRETLKTYETGELVAVYNTRSFQGERRATLTVTIDQPFYAQVQVQVVGYIRTDVVVDPGSVNLGSIAQGTPAERQVTIHYAGRGDWRIVDVQTVNPHVSAELLELTRGAGQVSYRLTVRLDESAPPGYLREQLLVLTNDARATQFPIDVEGHVQADVSVSPDSLFMGVLQPGQQATKQLVVRARRPFRILDIECGDDCFSFAVPDSAKTLHLVPVTFVAGPTPGRVTQTVRIRTDLGEDVSPELTVFAQVVEAP